MPTPPADRRVFMTRSRSILRHQQRRGGVAADYPLEAFRALVRQAMEQGCCYCGGPLRAKDFSLDHRTPRDRGGLPDPANFAVCHKACNEAKGALNEAEFRALLALVAGWPAVVARKFLARLRQGGQFRRGRG